MRMPFPRALEFVELATRARSGVNPHWQDEEKGDGAEL